MERQQVDAKKLLLSLKFSLANRTAMEIFAFHFWQVKSHKISTGCVRK